MNIKKITPYLIALFVFAGVALVYFSPVLKGEKIFQSDIQQFRGMSKEIKDFRVKHGEEPYWTDAAFGGMPSYQLSTYYPNNYIKKIDSVIRFLPRPADYLFLYFLGFFVLLMVLKFDWKLAIIGSLAFGFSTYFIIIIGVGHNAKAHAIGYIPIVLAGVLLVYQSKYLKGFLLTTLAMALEINTSHPQMTYYLGFVLLILGIVFLIDVLKTQKSIKSFAIQSAIIILGMVLALGMNASSLLATKQYADKSTRGKSELTITSDGKSKKVSTGLSYSYITEYSYGKMETFNLFIPRFTGGANSESLGESSETYKFLSSRTDHSQAKRFSENVPTYWGSQPIVAAPAYIGAVFIFLFVLGIFIVNSKLKIWLVAATIFSILMSWGHNFNFLTSIFIDYVPLYNKFRAVSSIQVIAEICIPLLGLLALKEYFSDALTKKEKEIYLKNSFYIVGGFALLFTLIGTSVFGFEGANDGYYDNMIKGLSNAIQADRKVLFFDDSLRSLLLVLATAAVLFLYIKDKIRYNVVLGIMAVLFLFDMVGTARRYVDTSDFHKASKIEKPFVKSEIDIEILKDKGHYRVANFSRNFMNDGATSYFHKSIGGYHAAKLGRYQELVDFHILKNNLQVFNMLNTKYFVISDESGEKELQVNPESNGNAWFVNDVLFVNSANEEIVSLADFDSKSTAIINELEFTNFKSQYQVQGIDSFATIDLKSYQANAISYQSNSQTNQLAVFSEIYYKEGWNAYVDGEIKPYIRVNYVLRALEVPAGKHLIEFKFEPTIIATGSIINLGSMFLFFLLSSIGLYRNKMIKNK
ncbi:YfhO family protein [Flavicella sp.]|uniref:YfhO family protein n=1 Tax=Flavicella sp. TaxID=2957742 RepID=UPI00301634CD